jgi:hypothetical protein
MKEVDVTMNIPERRMKIAFISQPEYFRFIYEDDLDDFADVFEFKLQMGLSVEDFAPLIEYQADYNFFFRGEFVPDGLLERLHGQKIALSSEPFPRLINGRREYTIDSINRYIDFRRIRHKPYDYLFHYDAASLPVLNSDGIHASGEFPFPVATSVYSHQLKPPLWDFFFIGRSTSHREMHFGHLKHYYNFLHICHGIWGPELVEYMCSAKICLNVHAENEISWEPRMQMMLSCGVFVISEKITPNTILRPGIDYVEIGSPSELHQAAEYYLHNAEERQRIARNGAERVRDLLDSRANFRRLIEDISDQKYEKFRFGRGAKLFSGIRKGRNAWEQMKRRLR